jgi:toxin-antitoxin system PIN domain toxin
MRALLDVNVLIALLDADHASHVRATTWFAAHARSGWASCPITQNGCIRIMSHTGYPNPLPARMVMQRLADACASPLHHFWPDDVSLLDPSIADFERIHGPRQLTDVYLLALAVRNGGQFVTFDSAVPLAAAHRAKRNQLVVL